MKRIHGEPGSIEFVESYHLAAKGEAGEKPTKGLFIEVINAYKASPKWRNLSAGSKRSYNYPLRELEARFGDTETRAFNDRKMRGKVLEWRDKRALTAPVAAELSLSLLKIIVKFAEARGMLDVNILAGVERHNSSRNRADEIWTYKEISHILAKAVPEVRWAVRLALLTGQRIGDLIRLKWKDINNGVLFLTQAKTLSRVEIPVGQTLASLLSEIPQRAETILTSPKGTSWHSTSHLRRMWASALIKAGLRTGKRFHDLRGTAITVMADMGCTESQIAAISGHSLEHVGKILKFYLSRTAAQAQQAVARLDSSWIGRLETVPGNQIVSH